MSYIFLIKEVTDEFQVSTVHYYNQLLLLSD